SGRIPGVWDQEQEPWNLAAFIATEQRPTSNDVEVLPGLSLLGLMRTADKLNARAPEGAALHELERVASELRVESEALIAAVLGKGAWYYEPSRLTLVRVGVIAEKVRPTVAFHLETAAWAGAQVMTSEALAAEEDKGALVPVPSWALCRALGVDCPEP